MSQLDKIAVALAAQPGLAPEAAKDDWLDAAAVFRIMRRRIGLISVVAALVLAASMGGILGMTHLYGAQTRLLIREPPTAGLQQPIFRPESTLNLANEVERLLSRDVALQVVHTLNLAERPEFNAALRPPSLTDEIKARIRALLIPPDETEAVEDDPAANVILSFLGHLSITAAAGSQVVSIEFFSEDPELAAQVPNALVRIYLEKRAEQLARQVDAAKGWLDRRIAEQHQRVDGAEAAAKTFRETSEVSSPAALDIAQTVTALDERRAALDVERQNLTARLGVLGALIEGGRWTEVPETSGQSQLAHDLLVQHNELDHLREKFGSNHPEVVAARKRVGDTESLIRAALLRQKADLETMIAATDREDEAVARRLDAAGKTVLALRSAEADLAALERDAQSERAALGSLEEQRRTLRGEADIPVADVEVLLPATVPSSHLGRGRSFYLAVALVGAAALGFAAALLREMLDGTVRSADHLRPIPGAVSAGLLPRVPARALRGGPAGERPRRGASFTDAIRATLFALEQSRGGRMPRSLLVSSVVTGEGKSTVAAALAGELVAAGHKVLLIDGDLGVGSLHRLVGAAPEPGLADYLSGAVDLAALDRLPDANGFGFIGRGSAGAQWHLDRNRLRQLIEAANQRGQIVLIDSAPVLATAFTPVLASLVERRLLVVRWGSTNRNALATAVQRLVSGTADEVHVVINRVNLRRQALYGFSDAGEVARTMRRFHRRSA